MDRSSNDKLQEAYQEVYLQEKGMSSDAMSSVLKGHKYSKKQLFDMSKKSTKEGITLSKSIIGTDEWDYVKTDLSNQST